MGTKRDFSKLVFICAIIGSLLCALFFVSDDFAFFVGESFSAAKKSESSGSSGSGGSGSGASCNGSDGPQETSMNVCIPTNQAQTQTGLQFGDTTSQKIMTLNRGTSPSQTVACSLPGGYAVLNLAVAPYTDNQSYNYYSCTWVACGGSNANLTNHVADSETYAIECIVNEPPVQWQ